jgi:GT2 family glycosyltransferase
MKAEPDTDSPPEAQGKLQLRLAGLQRQMRYLPRALRILRRRGREGLDHWRHQYRGPHGEILDPYQNWLLWSRPTARELARQRREAVSLAYRPLISIVTPVYNPPPPVLAATLRSALDQTYDHWELCLADGDSQTEGVRATLAEFAQADPRIKVTYLPENLGISGNSNEALRMAQGEFVALLDHDDMLAPNALWEIVRALTEHPETDILYYDEDKLSEDGRVRREPWFKPHRWSPDLFLSANCLMHGVLRRSLIESVGGFDSQTDGAQDWDLFFRCTEHTQRILHIPKVLYHWRQVPGSAATEFTAKPWVFEAQSKSTLRHIQRLGIPNSQLVFMPNGYRRVIWPIQGRAVSILVACAQGKLPSQTWLLNLLRGTTYPDFEIMLACRSSQTEAADRLAQAPDLAGRLRVVAAPDIANEAQTQNLAVQHATGQLLLFLNGDLEPLEAEWLEELARWAERPEIGAVATKLLDHEEHVQRTGLVLGLNGPVGPVFENVVRDFGGYFGSVDWYRNYAAVSGDCMMVRREVLESVGGLDETFSSRCCYVELCLRLVAQGLRIVYTPFAPLRLSSPLPCPTCAEIADRVPALQGPDPYFNPNLSLCHSMPMPAVPKWA